MSNVTPTSAAEFIPEVWAQEALLALRSKLSLAKLVTRDTDVAAEFTAGDILHIPVPGTLSANTKTAGSAVTLQAPNDSEVTVTLSNHKEVSFLIEDVTAAQANQSLRQRYMANAVIPLANAIEDALFALYSGFSTSTGTTGTDLTASSIRSARKKLNDNNAPDEGRALIVSTKDEVSILGDSTLADYFANARAAGVAEGSIGRAYGFDVYTSNRVPVVAGSPDSTKNLAITPEAMILAMRSLPTEQVPGAERMVVTDPESGLSIRVTAAYNASYLGVQVTLDVLYGVAELRDLCGVVVLS